MKLGISDKGLKRIHNRISGGRKKKVVEEELPISREEEVLTDLAESNFHFALDEASYREDYSLGRFLDDYWDNAKDSVPSTISEFNLDITVREAVDWVSSIYRNLVEEKFGSYPDDDQELKLESYSDEDEGL